MSDNQDVTLGEVSELLRGVSYRPPDLLARDERGVPLLRATNIGNRVLELDDVLYVPPALVRDYQLLRCYDVVIAMSSGSRQAIGRLAQLRKNWRGCVGAFCAIIRPNPNLINPEFLGYVLQSPDFRERIETFAEGTAIMNLSRERLSGFSFKLPQMQTQRAIARTLGALDDKIELNRQMNETLEAMARALFKSWFIDFDPVHAKAEGRDPGLPADIAALFPDSFQASEMGEIPEGWSVGSVDDDFELTMGQSPPGETYNEAGNGLPFYQGRSDFGVRFPTRRVYCTAPTRFASAGDTLVSVRAPVGDVNVATERCAIGRGVAAVRHKTSGRSFTYYFMRSINEVFAQFEADGTVFGSIGKKDFHAIPCVRPPHKVVLEFERRLLGVDGRIEANERESRMLAILRDTLLPKLLSGELGL